MAKNTKAKPQEKSPVSKQNESMIFGKTNFILLGASAVIILLGFILMSGSEDVVDVKSTKLTIAPVMVMIGFIVAIYSIMKKDKKEEETAN